MTTDLRCFLALILVALFPLGVQGQMPGEDLFQSKSQGGQSAAAGGVQGQLLPENSPFGGPQFPQSGGSLVLPSIGNTPGQRQLQRARNFDPAFDLRLPRFPPEVQALVGRIEFRDFVVQSTGQDLQIFGSNLFKNVPSTFVPVDNTPVTANYVIGPGDEILVHAWGQIDVDYTAVVDRTGTINLPKIGSINVAGVRDADLHAHLKEGIGQIFRSFDLSVTLGQARRPVSYTDGSMSSLVNAIIAAGGPTEKGSMRIIQLKRGNKIVNDRERLMPDDTIVVPEDFDCTTWTKVIKDYAQILFQMGLGVAALKVIEQ